LHSYRYAWAERSANAGYPDRYAQRALGQNSKIVHRAYARKAQGQLPSLEDYEDIMSAGKIMVLKSENESPAYISNFQLTKASVGIEPQNMFSLNHHNSQRHKLCARSSMFSALSQG
jgi:hypothetical protein